MTLKLLKSPKFLKLGREGIDIYRNYVSIPDSKSCAEMLSNCHVMYSKKVYVL